jgi:hypothetical protein
MGCRVFKENNVIVRKAGGAGFFCRKDDYVYIGGNDPLFAPAILGRYGFIYTYAVRRI